MSASSRIVKIRGDLDRDAFGAKIGVSGRTVQRWELNNELPKGKEVVKIAEVFNVNAHWLLTGNGDPYIKDRIRGSPQNIQEPNQNYSASGADNDSEEISMQDFRMSDALTMCARVLDSGTSYATALYLNIQHFNRALTAEERLAHLEYCQKSLEDKVNALAAKLDTFEEVQEQNNFLRKEVNRLSATYENPEDAPDTKEKAS